MAAVNILYRALCSRNGAQGLIQNTGVNDAFGGAKSILQIWNLKHVVLIEDYVLCTTERFQI